MPFPDPAEYSVTDLAEKVSEMDDVDDLESLLRAERASDDRSTATGRIKARLNAVTDDSYVLPAPGGDESSDESGSQSVEAETTEGTPEENDDESDDESPTSVEREPSSCSVSIDRK